MAKRVHLWLHKLSSPPVFYRFAGIVRPWALGLALLLGVVAAYGGLVLAPPDYQQHDAYRIIFIHVPSAWMSLFIYAAMGVSAFIALVWRIRLGGMVKAGSIQRATDRLKVNFTVIDKHAATQASTPAFFRIWGSVSQQPIGDRQRTHARQARYRQRSDSQARRNLHAERTKDAMAEGHVGKPIPAAAVLLTAPR
ncbi:cytochrome C-type biogenesis protein [Xanthomonas fragariae]|uniref:Heme exporter protein C n=1 Tax=Xanthomonas fragariae TaxID=48664 RepID=A0A1Y6HLI8_9XANT|nr:heme exporter protein C-cytochrome C-type biogenesis protein [Xanthomonas fragariae LMG 25863]SMQ95517.1 cytochrome C-type biogenesis protein [Xanthomonas fragariae]SMQ99058.1 Heme exporter protein C [Xanthomonas fragariae]SMR03100.1 cytochrome C-type biogenesis protein [Xanthomonas fragariae]